MRLTIIYAAILALAAGGALAQESPSSGSRLPLTTGQAPVGHRQPTMNDLPPDVAHKEVEPLNPPAQESRKGNVDSRRNSCRGCGPPKLVGRTSCDAAGRGSVVLGRNKESLPRRRDHGAGYAEAELVQILRRRQEPMRRHGENRRPGELCRAGVLPGGHAGRPQHPECRSAGERQRTPQFAPRQAQVEHPNSARCSDEIDTPTCVVAGLDPAISINGAQLIP